MTKQMSQNSCNSLQMHMRKRMNGLISQALLMIIATFSHTTARPYLLCDIMPWCSSLVIRFLVCFLWCLQAYCRKYRSPSSIVMMAQTSSFQCRTSQPCVLRIAMEAQQPNFMLSSRRWVQGHFTSVYAVKCLDRRYVT